LLTDSLSKLSCHSPRSEALVFALRLYCYLILRSVCQLCGWTVPRLVRGTSGAFRTSFVISPRYYTCYGQWSCCPVRGTIHAVGSMSVRPVRSTLHALGCLSNCPFRRIPSFALSPFICPFVCPFVCPFPFLSFPIPPPQTSAEIIFR